MILQPTVPSCWRISWSAHGPTKSEAFHIVGTQQIPLIDINVVISRAVECSRMWSVNKDEMYLLFPGFFLGIPGQRSGIDLPWFKFHTSPHFPC